MLLLACLLGLVAGLRTMTGLGVWLVVFGNGPWRVIGPVGAIAEYIVDALPQAPPRTQIIPSVLFRSIMGGVAGWLIAGRTDAPMAAAILAGIGGALIGTYGGYRMRMWFIARIGAIPAALLEDAIAIALAVLIVTRL